MTLTPEAQAKQETTHAIAYAATYHTKWFGVGCEGSEPPVAQRLASLATGIRTTSAIDRSTTSVRRTD